MHCRHSSAHHHDEPEPQEKKDRLRSESDYKVNLKSEIEIRTLHEKVDHLLLDQWAKMMRIQEIQIEILDEIRTNLNK